MNKRRARSVPQASSTLNKTAVALAKIDGSFRLARTAARWAGICLFLLCAGYALKPFAGQVTVISLLFSFLADIKFVAAVTLAGAAAVWAVAERMLRRRKTEQLQNRIIHLETLIDPRRSSSELTPRGTTNPKDR